MLELRGPQYKINTELEEMKSILKSQESSKSGICSKLHELSSRSTILPVLMMIVFMTLQVMTGFEIVSYYALDIFKRANVTMNNHILAILLASACTIGYAISSFLMRCVPRKVHFISSGLLMALSIITLGFTLQAKVYRNIQEIKQSMLRNQKC